MGTRLRVYVSTIMRGAKNELSGFIYSIDWHEQKIIRKISIPNETAHQYWNSRGGNRGGRGVAIDRRNSCIYVASATQILKYSMDLELITTLNHEYMAGIHEILLEDDGLWITSAVHDLVFKVGLDGSLMEQWWGSESTELQDIFGFTGRDINLTLDFPRESFESAYDEYCSEEIFHINAIAKYRGSYYVLTSTRKALLQIKPNENVVMKNMNLDHPHNLYITADGKALINDTRRQMLRVYDFEAKKLDYSVDTKVADTESHSKQFASPGWQRGLALINRQSCLIGSSPAQIMEVDFIKRKVGQCMHLDSDVRHCIHGLAVISL